jgi:hypothetical protein
LRRTGDEGYFLFERKHQVCLPFRGLRAGLRDFLDRGVEAG